MRAPSTCFVVALRKCPMHSRVWEQFHGVDALSSVTSRRTSQNGPPLLAGAEGHRGPPYAHRSATASLFNFAAPAASIRSFAGTRLCGFGVRSTIHAQLELDARPLMSPRRPHRRARSLVRRVPRRRRVRRRVRFAALGGRRALAWPGRVRAMRPAHARAFPGGSSPDTSAITRPIHTPSRTVS